MNASDSRVVLITGAAGGLGTALVQAFHRDGWNVAAGTHRTPLRETGDRILPLTLDVTQADSAGTAVHRVLERWGRIDVLINNAGLARDNLLARLSVEDWDPVMGVNLKGAYLCSRSVLPAMMRQRDGHILNLASFSGRVGRHGAANYSAAKAGLVGLTQSLAREVGPFNIRVNGVSPGYLPTALLGPVTPEDLTRHAASNALGRINETGEVARFMVFLAGMRNVSGQVFQLDSRIASSS
ncbi:MAG: SDR family NAD(P)-dependent oxidoreductase [Verrucomicrobiales bacterium]|nr:SDR family NAD(P)-dependent oxidoreductase [Verrucomicrobiales bacterium]